MEFNWNSEQLARKQEAMRFADAELNQDLVSHNRANQFDRDKWQKCADFGLFGLPVPKSYGGSDVDLMTTLLILEGIGYGCRENGLPFAINSLLWSVEVALLEFGTEEQKARYLPGLCSGQQIGAFAMTEPDTGSDAYAMKATAKKVEGGYILNGQKALITFGPVCDFAIVFANHNPELGRWGIGCFILEDGWKGFDRGEVQEKMGLRSVPFGDLTMTDCFVPDTHILGPEGAGVSIFNHSMEWERAFILVSQLGRMERQLDENIAFANERTAFSKTIGKFQAISHRIAEMKIRLETARLLFYKTAWLKQNGEQNVLEAAMTKLYISECFAESSLDTIRIHGGQGILTENEIERDLRDAVPGLFYSGTSDIQRNLIAQLIGVKT